MVTLYYGTLGTMYAIPIATQVTALNKIFSLLNTVFTFMVNLIMYSLRNKDVKKGVRGLISQWAYAWRT